MTSLKAGPTGASKQLQKCKPQPGRPWEDTHGTQSLPAALSCALPWETTRGRGWEQRPAPCALGPGPRFLFSSHKCSTGGGRDLAAAGLGCHRSVVGTGVAETCAWLGTGAEVPVLSTPSLGSGHNAGTSVGLLGAARLLLTSLQGSGVLLRERG